LTRWYRYIWYNGADGRRRAYFVSKCCYF